MRICVFEDAGVANLEPLTLTRPAFDLLCGACSLLERQCRHFGAAEASLSVRPPLAAVGRLHHPDRAVNDPAADRGAGLLVNSRWLPPPQPYAGAGAPCAALAGDHVAYVVPPHGLPAPLPDP